MSVEMDTVGPVRTFVVDNFLFGQAAEFKDGQSFLESGIVDSTGVLQLVAFLETHYGVEISDAELVPENLDSIDSISQYLQKKLSL